MTKSTPNIRREDYRLLTGGGKFVDDLQLNDFCVGYVVRSPYSHADIQRTDIEYASAMPGVQLVLTAAHLQAKGIGGLPCASDLTNRDGTPMFKPNRPILATDRVRYVGEPVAFVVADTLHAAMEAADAIEIDYSELDSASSTRKAIHGSAAIWDEAPHNVSFHTSSGDDSDVTEALNDAAHVVSIEVHHPRIAITPIEPRAAIAQYDSATQQYTLHVQTQGVHMVRRVLAQDVLKIPLENLRVITQDVGGSFGMKIFTYPEYALVLIASEKVGKPVKWTATRIESFVSDSHGRARIDFAQLGLDENGRFTALQIDGTADLGAYLSYVGPSVAAVYPYSVIGHTYNIPLIQYRCRGVFTNAPPVDAYRGAGKPETVCTLEQLIDKAAIELGNDRIELRRKNFVQPEQLPYSMPNGHVIDSGEFETILDLALEQSQWSKFSERRQESLNQGRLRGIGLGMYMHSTGGSPTEVCEVQLRDDGSILVLTGTQSGGQGHFTTLAAIAAEVLQIDYSRVSILQGDTDALSTGGGTGGSSLVAISGNTVQRAARRMLDNTREIVSHLLEVSQADIEYQAGTFYLPGTDQRISLEQIAARMGDMPQDYPGCIGNAEFEGINTTHPCGAYVAELECDPATGAIEVLQLIGVDDIGRILYPAIVDGQLHGSWAQSVGTSLMESVQFDEQESGQILTGSLMDYQLPRAADVPFFNLEKFETLCKTNPMGVKGVGEVASLGAPGAIQNAVSNMLSEDRYVALDGPATPLRIWKAIHKTLD